MSWTRIDNLNEVYHEFEYIREDAECQGFTDDFEVGCYVEDVFKKDFPDIWDKLSYDDIYAEYYEHELCEGEEKPTYAVYIYVNDKARNVIMNYYAEYFI